MSGWESLDVSARRELVSSCGGFGEIQSEGVDSNQILRSIILNLISEMSSNTNTPYKKNRRSIF